MSIDGESAGESAGEYSTSGLLTLDQHASTESIFISISGMIGAGKTTLAAALADKMKLPLYKEPVAGEPSDSGTCLYIGVCVICFQMCVVCVQLWIDSHHACSALY